MEYPPAKIALITNRLSVFGGAYYINNTSRYKRLMPFRPCYVALNMSRTLIAQRLCSRVAQRAQAAAEGVVIGRVAVLVYSYSRVFQTYNLMRLKCSNYYFVLFLIHSYKLKIKNLAYCIFLLA